MPLRRRNLFALIILTLGFPLLVFTNACQESSMAPENTDASDGEITVQELSSGTYSIWSYKLLKLSKSGYDDTYVQYFPPTSGARPGLLYTMPYGGITWSQNTLDNTWAARTSSSTPAFFSDLNGPNYNASTSKQISYYRVTPDLGSALVIPYLMNNVGVAISYGRFYSGGSIENDLKDTLLALEFLSQQTNIDSTRLGIYGASLGGFQAIYAAAAANARYRPLAGVAQSPLSDVEKFVRNDKETFPASGLSAGKVATYHDFYEPYIRRILQTALTLPSVSTAGYTNIKQSFLVNKLKTPFLVIHDEWDSIIPISHSQSLGSLVPSMISKFWYTQTTAINLEASSFTHNLDNPAWKTWATNMLAESYLLGRILPASTVSYYVYYSYSDMDDFMISLYTQQGAGKNMAAAAERLMDLCDSRIILVDYNSASNGIPNAAGRDVVAAFLNSYWNTSLTGVNVKSYLQANGLPPH
ncbi:Prolyl oligopeptidase family protein [compost metagenome]